MWFEKIGVVSEERCGFRRKVWFQKKGVVSEDRCGLRR